VSGEAPSRRVLARFYRTFIGEDGEISLDLVEEPLEDVRIDEGRLIGPGVVVDTRAVQVGTDGDGRLVGLPVEPLGERDGSLCFDPSQGGVRARENRRARGAFNRVVAEANHFGMVNAYVHTRRAATFAQRLLAAVGAGPIPPVTVVVGAHFGSQLPGYASGDGNLHSGTVRPLSGGHYRLSTRTTDVPEPFPVDPTGEIHLGPRRYRKPFAGWQAYLANAAHNPAIVYHEFGHHLCRHTADFRLNAERPPEEQRNGKTGIEEGICDYLTAALLGTGRPYGWYRAERGRLRDPVHPRRIGPADDGDPHAEGAAWAAALWRCRSELVEKGFLGSPAHHDEALAATLVRIGEMAGPESGRGRARRERKRSKATTMAAAYRSALEDRGGIEAAREAERVLKECGLAVPEMAQGAERC
jgi:hypothetical protein